MNDGLTDDLDRSYIEKSEFALVRTSVLIAVPVYRKVHFRNHRALNISAVRAKRRLNGVRCRAWWSCWSMFHRRASRNIVVSFVVGDSCHTWTIKSYAGSRRRARKTSTPTSRQTAGDAQLGDPRQAIAPDFQKSPVFLQGLRDLSCRASFRIV